jgi:hypothetical protein
MADRFSDLASPDEIAAAHADFNANEVEASFSPGGKWTKLELLHNDGIIDGARNSDSNVIWLF